MEQLKNLNFHLTFPPTADGIARLLSVADREGAFTKEELSEQTGIPTGKKSGKVVPYIQYAVYMGLLTDRVEENRHTLSLTPLGREVRYQDPGLRERVSLLVCHARLSAKQTGASLWSYLFKSIFPKYPDGIPDAMLRDELQKAAKPGAEVNRGPFLSSYAGLFGPLRLLEAHSDRLCPVRSSYDPELLYAYAYALLYEWETRFPERREITADELDSLEMATTLGLSRDGFAELLHRLSDRGIAAFNRQLVPYTAIKLHTSEEIIPLLYSLLC